MSARRPFATPFGEAEDTVPNGSVKPKLGLGLLAHSPAKLLHASLLATALCIFAWPIALPVGLIAGALAAALGTVVAEKLVERRYRLVAVALLSAAILLAGRLLILFFSNAAWIAELLTPVLAMHLAEAIRWASAGLGAAIALRAAALRYRAALAIEGGVVVLAVATTVAAHRDGMIARPLEISDWFWTQGIDPVIAFLAIGVAGAILLAGVLAYGRSPKRTVAQLCFVLLLAIVLATRIHGADVDSPKKNPVGQQLESKDDSRSGTKANGGQGGKGDKEDQRDGSPFNKDGTPSPGSGEQHQKRPAAIVVFHKDVQPAGGVFYFRHTAFSQYNGVRLVAATRPGVDGDLVRDFPTVRQDVPGAPGDVAGRTLVATDVALITEHHRPFTLTDATEIAPLANPEPARFRRAYRVVSSVVTEPYQDLLGSNAGDPGWSDEIWEHYTELPKDKRYRQLADELKSHLRSDYQSDPMAQAMVVKQYLEENATYSFKKNYDGEEDPIAAFLFSEEKLGYCVHTSGAAVFLLRAMGVPARLSAGYGVPAAQLGGGSALLIKDSDAHQWAEIYLEGMGWVPIEVTPEKTDIKPDMFAEKDLQQLLGEMARKEGRESREQYQGPKLMDAIRAFMAVVPWILLALIALAYGFKVWRLLAPSFARAEKRPRVAYRAALDRLSAIGLLRTRGEPRERFARRVEPISPSFVPLTSTHVGVAFGSRDVQRSIASIDPPPLVDLSRRVGAEVRRRAPWWRWVLGVLNPVSWLWSR